MDSMRVETLTITFLNLLGFPPFYTIQVYIPLTPIICTQGKHLFQHMKGLLICRSFLSQRCCSAWYIMSLNTPLANPQDAVDIKRSPV